MSSWDKQQIITSYKQAKNKAEQITILAQLTASDGETITAILEDAGAYEGAYKNCAQCGKTFAFSPKKGGKRICAECRRRNHAIYQREWEIKKNLSQMQELMRKNAELRQEVEEMKVTT